MKVKVDATTNKRETNRKRDRVELIPSSPTSCDTVLGKIKKKQDPSHTYIYTHVSYIARKREQNRKQYTMMRAAIARPRGEGEQRLSVTVEDVPLPSCDLSEDKDEVLVKVSSHTDFLNIKILTLVLCLFVLKRCFERVFVKLTWRS